MRLQVTKERSWLEQQAEAMELALDEDMVGGLFEDTRDSRPNHKARFDGGEGPSIGRSRGEQAQRSRADLDQKRRDLAAVLQQPLLPRSASVLYPTSNIAGRNSSSSSGAMGSALPRPLTALPAVEAGALAVAREGKRGRRRT